MTKQSSGYIYILIAGVLWGSIGFFVSILKDFGVESTTIAFLRIGMGAMILVPIMLIRGGLRAFRIDKGGLFACLALGIFCQAMFNFAYNESISNVGVATASVLLYTAPVFVCIMSRIFFKEEIGAIKLIALAVNIFGCVLTVTGGDFTTISFSFYGVIAGVMAGFLYGLMTIISKTTTDNYDPFTIIFYSFLFGAIVLAIFTKPWLDIGEAMELKFVLAAIGYGLIPTVGSYLFYMKGLSKKPETSKVPIIASVETVVAAIIGIILFSESHGIFKIIGICCVVASIAIMNFKKEGKGICSISEED
ncbi:MAG TPA: DMT family transporter [Anaerovoracaceae bacterium]|nr:DMT family transporter [Anaerovoracaceae bacterium]